MKKMLLLFAAIAGLTFVGSSQCTPDPLYLDSTMGAWPDTATDFAPAYVGTPYSEVLNLKMPADAGEVDPAFAGTPVDSGSVDNVQGLPPGLTYTCNTATCSWLGGAQGCAVIEGTPTTEGVYDVTINMTGWMTISIPPLPPQVFNQAVPFTGYRIVVTDTSGGGGTGVEVFHKDDFMLKNNAPNPFSTITNIAFLTGKSGKIDFRVMNLLGEIVYSEIVNAKAGTNKITLNGEGLGNGIYVYSLSNGERVLSKRMIKSN